MKINQLSDCEWEVAIRQFDEEDNQNYWIAFAGDESGVEILESGKLFEFENEALKHWRLFAKVNKIKKWRLKI